MTPWFGGRDREKDDSSSEDARELERLLASVRFEPRASLGPEVLGRVRRERPAPRRFSWRPFRIPAIGVLVIAASATWLVTGADDVTVDRCCYDFDGGGEADDGVAILVRSKEHVQRIAVYEDRDGSRSLTPGDILRFDGAPTLTIPDVPAGQLVTLRHCCSDYDGEGPPDDGVVVVASPPDRVTMVGMYERGDADVTIP